MIEKLYTVYRDDVYRYLVSLTHDAARAEDLLSETFLQALQSIDRFEARSGEKTWLFGIARHLWLQDLRRRRPTVCYDDLLGLYVEDTLPDTAVQRELLARIRALLEQKDERTRGWWHCGCRASLMTASPRNWASARVRPGLLTAGHATGSRKLCERRGCCDLRT